MTNLQSFIDLEKEFSKFSKNCLARQKNDNIFKISLKFHFFTTNGPLNTLDINITKKIAFIGPQELLKNCMSNCPPQAVEEPAPSVGKGKKKEKKNPSSSAVVRLITNQLQRRCSCQQVISLFIFQGYSFIHVLWRPSGHHSMED